MRRDEHRFGGDEHAVERADARPQHQVGAHAGLEQPPGQQAADERADAILALDLELSIRDRAIDGGFRLFTRVQRETETEEVASALERLLDRLVIEMERF